MGDCVHSVIAQKSGILARSLTGASVGRRLTTNSHPAIRYYTAGVGVNTPEGARKREIHQPDIIHTLIARNDGGRRRRTIFAYVSRDSVVVVNSVMGSHAAVCQRRNSAPRSLARTTKMGVRACWFERHRYDEWRHRLGQMLAFGTPLATGNGSGGGGCGSASAASAS